MDHLQSFAAEIGAKLVEKAALTENAKNFLDSLSKYLTAEDIKAMTGVNSVMTRNLKRGTGGHATLQNGVVTLVFNERLMGRVPDLWFASLVVHELEHVKQFREKGGFGYGEKDAETAAYGAEVAFLNRLAPKLNWLEKRQSAERIEFAKKAINQAQAGQKIGDGLVDAQFLKADDEEVLAETEVNVEPAPTRPTRAAKKLLQNIAEDMIARKGPAQRKKIKDRRQGEKDQSETEAKKE
jgi:predicted SprT family Zn-dependent metalloprotease